MLWEEYYDKLGDWATSTAVSRMSQLESFGPSEEIIDAINQIGFDDEKGATRLLKKALAAGVKFTGDQLSELFLICDEEVINRAVQFSSDQFRTEDLDALYGFCDEEELVNIAKKQNLPVPESLLDFAEAFEYDIAEDEAYVGPSLTPMELASEYNYILDCLYQAHKLLKTAYMYSVMDMSKKKRAVTVLKYAYLVDAQTFITNALDAWTLLEAPNKNESLLQGIRLNIGNAAMWNNYLVDGLSSNLFIKWRIRKVMKNIEKAHKAIQRLRDAI